MTKLNNILSYSGYTDEHIKCNYSYTEYNIIIPSNIKINLNKLKCDKPIKHISLYYNILINYYILPHCKNVENIVNTINSMYKYYDINLTSNTIINTSCLNFNCVLTDSIYIFKICDKYVCFIFISEEFNGIPNDLKFIINNLITTCKEYGEIQVKTNEKIENIDFIKYINIINSNKNPNMICDYLYYSDLSKLKFEYSGLKIYNKYITTSFYNILPPPTFSLLLELFVKFSQLFHLIHLVFYFDYLIHY